MSTFDETNVRRQPEGVSTGGQFATKPRGESDVTLAVPAASELDAELDALQSAREEAQERWRSGRARVAANHDVDVLSMHVLARDVLCQHPHATHVRLAASDQVRDGMAALYAMDEHGNAIPDATYPQWDPFVEDNYTAASDMRAHGAWREHATQLPDSDSGETEYALDLRAVIAQPVVLADGTSPLAAES